MRYKLLGKSGLRVSEACLGTMTFGAEWGFGSDKAECKKMFDLFVEFGGNFIDTANRYTEGTSEIFLGEFMNSIRHKIVLATKYSLYTQKGDINDGGNHRKNLIHSVEGSLKRLKTDYIDVLYLHAWDFTTPIDEVLRGLDDLVRQGKVCYLGISDTPAWIISRANAIAELRAWTQFIVLQIEYSLLQRTPERDLLPMAKALDITTTSWGAIGGGALTGKYLTTNADEPKRLKPESARLNERNTIIAKEVVAIAAELGLAPSSVALKWAQRNTIPILGVRTYEQLKQNLDFIACPFTDKEFARLDAISAIELGFPHDFLQSVIVKDLLFGGLAESLDKK